MQFKMANSNLHNTQDKKKKKKKSAVNSTNIMLTRI